MNQAEEKLPNHAIYAGNQKAEITNQTETHIASGLKSVIFISLVPVGINLRTSALLPWPESDFVSNAG